MVELRRASKSYGSTAALHPTDLQFADGQTTALIGPSGCGKSTLLRLIIGLIEPTSGQVLFDGKAVTDANVLDIRRRTGYVIQDGGLFPHLTCEDNVTLVARMIEADPVKISKRVAELSELVRIPKDLLSRFPAELSGGQRQRVSLMRALVLEPKVLLLDEPLAALDPMVRAALQTDLKRIFQELGTTVILVTHDMGEAAYLGQTIVLLREGKIVQIGKLEDFQKAPKEPFVTEFLNAQRSLVAL
jgi:osmoprotectant transport system ATP-binding protein